MIRDDASMEYDKILENLLRRDDFLVVGRIILPFVVFFVIGFPDSSPTSHSKHCQIQVGVWVSRCRAPSLSTAQ